MKTLATLTGSGQADKGNNKAAAQSPQHVCPRRPNEASISIPKLGVTVSISAQGLSAAADLAHGAVKLGNEGAQLVGKAAQAISDATGTVAEAGVVAALTGGALLAAL